jgi:hypothetical protein
VGRWGAADARVVFGRVSRRRVRLTARPRSVRNGWSPTVRGQLLPAGAGCRLVGTIAWRPFTQVFTAIWLTLATLSLIGGTIGFVVLVAGGQVTAGDVPLIAVPALLVCFGGGLVTAAGTAGWRDADFLRGWLAERLQAPGRSEVATVGP